MRAQGTTLSDKTPLSGTPGRFVALRASWWLPEAKIGVSR